VTRLVREAPGGRFTYLTHSLPSLFLFVSQRSFFSLNAMRQKAAKLAESLRTKIVALACLIDSRGSSDQELMRSKKRHKKE
jgi:hypothetical protein